jgi:hypothetical protein
VHLVDSFCIDKFNTAERNIQVTLMRQIYSNATSVLSWLEPAAKGSDHGRLSRFSQGEFTKPVEQRQALGEEFSAFRARKLVEAASKLQFFDSSPDRQLGTVFCLIRVSVYE